MGKYKERLIEREKMIAEGKYPELILKKTDPIKWEVLYSRLSSLVQNARETARRISASPVVREMGECIFALFTPEGDSVCFSTGLFLHVPNMGSTAKWMLMNDYEETVGIREGDHFLNNDPYIAGVHAPDQTTVTPIFYKGELIGWAGALNHVPEVGAIEAGGTTALSQTRFDEGLFMPCIKIAENDEFKRDLEILVERNTRTAVWWLLDSRARSAGINMIREGVKRLIDDYGYDYYRQASYEYIEDTRQACIKRVKDVLFPGKYYSSFFVDVPNEELPVRHKENFLLRVPVETTITPQGEVMFDFTGASPAGPFPHNSALRGTLGCVINQLIQNVFYDIKYNQGSIQAYNSVVPYSVLNPPEFVYPTAEWLCAVLASGGVVDCISRAYYEMGYREEVWSGIPTVCVMHLGGKDQYGRPVSMSLFQPAFSGMPASGVFDGLDISYAFFNPETDITDAEMWEKIMPLVYLGRRILRDSGGFGKYRGGNSLEELLMVDSVPSIELSSVAMSNKVFTHHGTMGGYPAAASYRYCIENTNMKELIDKRLPLPHDEGEDSANPVWNKLGVKGDQHLTVGSIGERPFKKYDLFHMISTPAGGYGDPIERDPWLVKKDIELDLATLKTAEKVYCVSIDPHTLEVDLKKTEALRQRRREDRKRRGIPAREYLRAERERIMRGGLPTVVRKCFAGCFKSSERFRKEFINFWGLTEDFQLME